MKAILAWMIFLSGTPCFARLNQPLNICVERYGEPVSKNEAEGSYVFEKNGYQISIFVLRGYCHGIIYKKLNGGALSQTELEVLLNNNGDHMSQITDDAAVVHVYKEPQGGIVGVYNELGKRLVVTTKFYRDSQEKSEAAAAKGL